MKLIAPLATLCLCAVLLSACGRNEPATRAATGARGGGGTCCPPTAATEPAPVAAPPHDGLTLLAIRLPKPTIVNTPKDVKDIRLDPATLTADGRIPERAAITIAVPPGTANVALHRPVTSSDPEPIIGDLKMVTDGDKEATDGSYVELGPGVQWVQIDLGAPHELHALAFWHHHADVRAYRAVVVQAANDPDFIAGVTTLFNNDHENRAGLGLGTDYEYFDTYHGKVVQAKGTKARYVRLYSKGNTSDGQNHYIEVEVYGTPAK